LLINTTLTDFKMYCFTFWWNMVVWWFSGSIFSHQSTKFF